MTTSSKRWALALAVSLGLNLFLLGAATVHWTRRGPPPDRAGPGVEGEPQPGRRDRAGPGGGRTDDGGPALLREMVRVLGGPGDPRVQRLWSERRQDMRKFRSSMDSARQEVRAALVREPFDQAELEQALGRLHTISSEAQRHSEGAVLALARSLSPEERKKLAASRRGPPH